MTGIANKVNMASVVHMVNAANNYQPHGIKPIIQSLRPIPQLMHLENGQSKRNCKLT